MKRDMEGRKWLWLLGIVIGVFAILAISKTGGSLIRAGFEGMWNSYMSMDKNVQITNYYEIMRFNHDELHFCLELILWITFVWIVVNFCKVKGKRLSAGHFIGIWIVFFVALEVLSYIAFVVQFVIDAVVSGITSQEPNLMLKNIISWSRWKKVDIVGRACEAFIAAWILFTIGNIAEKRNRRKEARKKKVEERKLREDERKQCESERRNNASRHAPTRARNSQRDMRNPSNHSMAIPTIIVEDDNKVHDISE